MALTAEEHIRFARHCESFVRFLKAEKTKWPQWTMTAIFYSALHYAQALIVASSKTANDHMERNALLSSNWPDLKKPYGRLYQYAQDARYEAYKHNENRLKLAMDLLEEVKKEVQASWPTQPPPSFK